MSCVDKKYDSLELSRADAIGLCVKVVLQALSGLNPNSVPNVNCDALLEWYHNVDAGVRAEIGNDVESLTLVFGYENKFLDFITA